MNKLANLLMTITHKSTREEAITTIKQGGKSTLLIVLLVSAIIILSCKYLSFNSTKIGVVNINGIIDEFIKTQAKSGLSYEELRKNVKGFGVALEKVLHELSAKKHLVLMPAEAVLAGAKDYTDEVQRLLPKLPESQGAPREITPHEQPPQPPAPGQNHTQLSHELMLNHLKQKIAEGQEPAVIPNAASVQQAQPIVAPSQ